MDKSLMLAAACAMGSLLSVGAFAACPAGMEGMGLTIWLDATDIDGLDDGNPAENTAINSWKDKASGLRFTPIINGFNADQYLPHIHSSGRAGKDVVSFGRSNATTQGQYLGVTDPLIATLFDNTNTAFVVAQSSLGGADNDTQKTTYFFARKGYHSGFGFWGYPKATNLQSTRWFGGTGGTANGSTQPMAPYSDGTWVAASRVVRGGKTITGTSTEISINNQLLVATTNSNVSIWGHGGNANTMYVGISGTQNGTYCGAFSGHMAEMLIFNRELTAEESKFVWDYLNARWHISAADGFTYDDGVIQSDDDSVKRTDLGEGRIAYEFVESRGKVRVQPCATLSIERALLVGGGGAGGATLGGGGAGGAVVELADVAIGLSDEFTLSVGEGGVSQHLRNLQQAFWGIKGGSGHATTLNVHGDEYVAFGGGGGASWSAGTADSTSEAAPLANAGGGSGTNGKGGTGLDHSGADVVAFSIANGNGAGGGAGAGGNGQAAYQDGSLYYAGMGGLGVSSGITGTELDYGAGGGAGGGNGIHRGVAGGASAGDGGEASNFGGPQIGFDGLDGRGGGGGGGGYANACTGGRGGSGAVILVVRQGDLAIADSFSRYAKATASGKIVFTYVREAEPGSSYLVSMEADPSLLPAVGWTACGGDLPTFQIPSGTPFGTVTVYYHIKDAVGGISTYSADIEYVDPSESVPVVNAKNAIVTYDEAVGGVAPITVKLVKDSVTDKYGIYSETLDVTGICTPSTNTTLTVTNRLGISASAVATVTASPLSCFVSPAGSDETGTGWRDSPFKTITNAVALAAAGYATDGQRRTVCLVEGVYSASEGQGFPINLAEGVNFVGAGMGKTVIDAEGGANHLVIPVSTAPFEIADFSLRNAKSQFLHANAANLAFRNVEMSGCTAGAVCIDVNTCANSRKVSFENLVMTNITVAAILQNQLIHCGGSGSLSFDRCHFADITILPTGNATGIKICYAQNTGADHYYTAGWPATFTDCVFERWSYPGVNGSQEIGVITMANTTGPHIIDRCVFRDMKVTNNQRGVLLSPNRANTNFIVRNSLFQDIEGVVFNSFQSYPTIRNCTVHGCDSVFWPYNTYMMQAFNCSVSSCSALCAGTYGSLYIRNCNISDTPYEGQFNADNSGDLTTFDPYYKNAEAGNFSLKPLSKLVDLGNNSYVSGDRDLAGATRIADGGCGAATVDVGCFEYDPNASFAGIKFESNNYGVFEDRSVTLRAKVDPAPVGTVTANVTYPDGLFGPGTVVLGGDWTSFTVTATNEFEQADGTVVELTLSSDGGDLEDGSAGITLYSRFVSVPGYKSRLFLREGETLSLGLRLPSSEFAAPGAIGVTAGETGGSGSSSIAWNGEGFASGANAADQSIEITGGIGRNTLTLTLGGGFSFAESNDGQLTIEVVGFASPLAVDPRNGSDETGLGTEASPLASLNYALSHLRSGEGVAATAGLYTTISNGGHESAFPIVVAPGITITGVRGAADDESSSTVVNPDGGAGAFVLGTLGADPGAIAAGGLENIVISNSFGVAIHGRYWRGTIENCALRNISGVGVEQTVGGYFEWDKGDIAMVGVEACDITSSAIRLFYFKDGTANVTCTNCHFHDLKFTPNSIGSSGLVESRHSTSSNNSFVLSDCLFEDIVNTVAGGWGESLGMLHAYNSAMLVERCVLRDLTVNYPVICGNRVTVNTRDSLFHNVSGGGSLFYTFRAQVNMANCTMDSDDVVVMNNSDGNYPMVFSNCSISRAKLNVSGLLVDQNHIHRVILRNCNLSEVDEGTGYSVDESSNVFDYDPCFRNPTDGDYHLRSYSGLRDAGSNAYVASAVDLDGNARIFREEKSGIVDIGCYENSTLGGTVIMVK